MGNPETWKGDDSMVNGTLAHISKGVQKFQESDFYSKTVNDTLIPNYEAIALSMDFKRNSSGDIVGIEKPKWIGNVVFPTSDAMLFVTIFFVAHIVSMVILCTCWSMGSTGLDLINDVSNI